MIRGVDLSHHQGAVRFPELRAGGCGFVVLKATEGEDFRDPRFAASRAAARAAGLVVGSYHVARAGDPAAEAAFFARTTGPPAPGEFAALDWEVAAPDPVGWCAAWLAAASGSLGVRPLLYLDRSRLHGADWSPVVAAGSALWLACWDGGTGPVAAGAWPRVTVKQYSDAGAVPGVDGPVDLDVLLGGAAELRALGRRAA